MGAVSHYFFFLVTNTGIRHQLWHERLITSNTKSSLGFCLCLKYPHYRAMYGPPAFNTCSPLLQARVLQTRCRQACLACLASSISCFLENKASLFVGLDTDPQTNKTTDHFFHEDSFLSSSHVCCVVSCC